MSKYVLIGLIVIVALGGAFGAWWFLSSAREKSPEEIFQTVLFNPIPAEVQNIQGSADTKDGHKVLLKFTGNETTLNRIVNLHNYSEVDCNVDEKINTLPPEARPTNPQDTQRLQTLRCFHAQGYSNQMANQAQSQLLYYPDTNAFYFYEKGV